MQRIYLGGPIAGCTFEEIHERRNFLKNQLGAYYHFVDPTTRGLFKDGLLTPNDIVDGDKELIDRCDIVIIDAWKVSVGTCMEMMYAWFRGKTILVIANQADFGPLNPWYTVHASVVCFSLEAAVSTLADLYLIGDLTHPHTVVSDLAADPIVPVKRDVLATAREFQRLTQLIGTLNDTWWKDPATGERLARNYGEMLMLTVCELAESMEAYRKDAKDDHLPERRGVITELFAAIIRLSDMLGHLMTEGEWIVLAEKLAYNAVRADHKPAHRLLPGGKKC